MATSVSQCTYRCVVLPDKREVEATRAADGLNAPTGAWCSLTPGDSGGGLGILRLNAPTGAWCSLTPAAAKPSSLRIRSQCTYRCVVLPDPCLRERRYDATSRAWIATGPGSTPPDRPAPGSD